MSYILETLGRGLLSQLLDAFEAHSLGVDGDDVETLEARRQQSPTSADIAMRLGVAYLRDLQLNNARRVLEEAERLGADPTRARLAQACVYDELGDAAEALRRLRAAAQLDPKDSAIAFAIGLLQERMGSAAEARAAYQRARELCPRLRNAHERLAAMSVIEGRVDDARADYERLTELDPDDVDVLISLGALCLAGDDPRAAIDHFQQALLIEPDAVDSRGDHPEDADLRAAIDEARRLVDLYPGSSEMRVRLGDLLARSGADGAAVQQYSAALELHPTFLEATIKLGAQHLREQRYAQAARYFTVATELNDRLILAFAGLGYAQRMAGLPHDADATLNLAVGLAPNSTLLFSESARLQFKAERGGSSEPTFLIETATLEQDCEDMIAAALRRYEDAISDTPNDAELHYRKGLLLRRLERTGEAVASFRTATLLLPHFVKAQLMLGTCLRETGRHKESEAAFALAFHSPGPAIELYYSLALLFAHRNHFELALEHAAFEQNDTLTPLQSNLSTALQAVGMVDRGESAWRTLCAMARKPGFVDPSRFAEQDAIETESDTDTEAW
ncbi:MAG: tetratricopeptide repeat protein [Phycisphaerales bacterium]|nr:tetratricopeptide repeat protein [Phycisphaerales bacterium]